MKLFPREHGAWSMLLQPFLAAAILARTFHWTELAALLGVATAFVIRQPLVVLARQRYVWRTPHSETKQAQQVLLTLSVIGAALAITLLTRWPAGLFISMTVGAAAMTLLAVGATIKNLQRSIPLQIASAAGLTASCLAAATSACGVLPSWACWLWGALALQASAAILVVHVRLDARIRLRKPDAELSRPDAAFLAQGFLLLASLTLATRHDWWLAAAMGLPAIVNGFELSRISIEQSLRTPLTTVGLRAMAISIAVSILLTIGLWNRSGCVV